MRGFMAHAEYNGEIYSDGVQKIVDKLGEVKNEELPVAKKVITK